MGTYTIHPHERHHTATEWTLHHPMVATAATVTAAVVAGALVGILFSLLFQGAPVAQQHRAGGHHARVAASHVVAVGAVGNHTVIGATTRGATRSPARGGFAVGRTAGARSGSTSSDISAGRTQERQGFPGRSLGAGEVPTGALASKDTR